jgi:hypothetical protein
MRKRRSLKTGGGEPKSAALPAFKYKDDESKRSRNKESILYRRQSKNECV